MAVILSNNLLSFCVHYRTEHCASKPTNDGSNWYHKKFPGNLYFFRLKLILDLTFKNRCFQNQELNSEFFHFFPLFWSTCTSTNRMHLLHNESLLFIAALRFKKNSFLDSLLLVLPKLTIFQVLFFWCCHIIK